MLQHFAYVIEFIVACYLDVHVLVLLNVLKHSTQAALFIASSISAQNNETKSETHLWNILFEALLVVTDIPLHGLNFYNFLRKFSLKSFRS